MIEYLGPNEKALEIIRLHLERLPMMTDEDRHVFLDITRMLMSAPILVHAPITRDTGRPVYTAP